ncbi:MAG: response regulator transcription factor, partial [Lachnospiraceae bacterium]
MKGDTVERVLIVDDEPAIQKLLEKVMRSNGLESKTASSGEAALNILSKESFDLIMLDVMMGNGIDGFQVVERLRKQHNPIPIIILSAKNEDYDTLYGLELGADDYITKPFNPVVLGAKVKALIRRNQNLVGKPTHDITAGPFRLNLATMKFYKSETEIILSSKETALMSFFMKHMGQVFSKDQLYNQIWGETLTDPNTIMVYINHLRSKIEDDPKNPVYIRTVWG